MELETILDEIRGNLTGDPSKDGPYLKEQAEKYKEEEFSAELERELSDILVKTTEKNYKETLHSFLEAENSKVNEQLEYAEKRFRNKNFNGGIAVLEDIIRNNALAWVDTDEYVYKSFGTPLEYILFKTMNQQETREVRPINCDLSRVYRLYCYALCQKGRKKEALKAIEKAVELNPSDPENYIRMGELAKLRKDKPMMKRSAENLLKTAVSKKQVGQAYFTYSYYYSEMKQFDKALALLQMSGLFRTSKLYDSELKYIMTSMGKSGEPPYYDKESLMNILLSENIQPGPSASLVAAANSIAKQLEEEDALVYAKYFYSIVLELTEDEKTNEKIKEIDKKIK